MRDQAMGHVSAISRLWRRAPLWRSSLVLAVASGAVFVIFPPQVTPPVPAPTKSANGSLGPTVEYTPTLPPRPIVQAAAAAPSPSQAVPPPRTGEAPDTGPSARSEPADKAATTAARDPLPLPVPPPARPVAPGPAVAGLTRPDPGLMQQPGLPSTPSNPNLGTAHRGVYDILGRRVPLPAGEFQVLAHQLVMIGGTEGVTAALGQIEGGRLTAAVAVFASPAGHKLGTGMRGIALCNRTDIHYKEVSANEDFDKQDCFVVNHIWPAGFRGRDASNVIKSFVAALDARNVPLPPALIHVFFNNADRDGYMRISYYFNPESRGVTSRETATWRESDWHMDYIARDVRKVDYMDAARRWAQGWRPYMRQSFEGGLTSLPPAGLALALR